MAHIYKVWHQYEGQTNISCTRTSLQSIRYYQTIFSYAS